MIWRHQPRISHRSWVLEIKFYLFFCFIIDFRYAHSWVFSWSVLVYNSNSSMRKVMNFRNIFFIQFYVVIHFCLVIVIMRTGIWRRRPLAHLEPLLSTLYSSEKRLHTKKKKELKCLLFEQKWIDFFLFKNGYASQQRCRFYVVLLTFSVFPKQEWYREECVCVCFIREMDWIEKMNGWKEKWI